MDQRPPTLPPDRDAFTIPEFAARMHVNTRTAERMIAKGELRAIKLGRCTRIPAKEVRRLLGGTR